MSSDDEPMTCVQAIKYVMDNFGITSMKALAESLSDDELTIQTIQISRYINKGMRPSQKVADRFFDVYGVVISNVHQSGMAEAVRLAMEKED